MASVPCPVSGVILYLSNNCTPVTDTTVRLDGTCTRLERYDHMTRRDCVRESRLSRSAAIPAVVSSTKCSVRT